MDKDQIVTAAREKVEVEFGNTDKGASGLCLYFAVQVCRELYRNNIRGIIQAGSAQWRCMDIDDGVAESILHICGK